MPTLEIQGLGEVEVSDSFLNLSGPEQQSLVNQIYANAAQGQTSGNLSVGAGVQPSDGFFDRAGDVIELGAREFAGSSAEGAAAVLQSLGVAPETQLDLRQYAKDQDVEISKIPGIKPLQEAEDVGDAVSSILQYTGASLPALGASVAAGAVTGAAAGSFVPGPGTLLGAIGGGAAALYLSFVGQNVDEIKRKKGTDVLTNEDLRNAQTAAVGQALTDSLINRLIPIRTNPRAMVNVIQKTIAGAGVEGSTEVAQEALTILQANDFNPEALRTDEAKYRLTEALLAGGGMGGVVGGVSGLLPKIEPTTAEGASAVAQAENLQPATARAEIDILKDSVERLADTDADIFSSINNSIQLLSLGDEPVTFKSVQDDIENRLKNVKKQIKDAPDAQKKDLEAQQAILKSATKKMKQLLPEVRAIAADEADLSVATGEVRAGTVGSQIASGQGILSSVIRAGSRATLPIIEAAKTSPVMEGILRRFDTFDPLVKQLKQQYIAPVVAAQEPLLKALKLPLTSPVSKKYRKVVANVLNANRSGLDEPVNVADVQRVLSAANLSADEQQAVIDSANALKTNYDNLFKVRREQGLFTDEDYVLGYIPEAHKWLRRGQKGIREFADSASKIDGITRSQAEKIAENIMSEYNAPGREFSASDIALRGSIMSGIRRTMGFEKSRTLPRKVTDQLLKDGLIDDDIFNVSTRYAEQVAHASAMNRLFGDKTPEGKNQFKELLDSQRDLYSSPTMDAAVSRASDIYDAMQGTYNPFKVPRGWRGAISKLIQAEYIFTLSNAGLTALTEPIITLMRARPGDLFYAIPTALNIAYRKTIRDIFPRLKKNEVEAEFEKLLYGIDSALSERLVSSSAVDVSSIVTEKYFKLNLLSQITQFSRAVAYFSAKRIIDRDLAVARTLPETNSGKADKQRALTRLSEVGIRDVDNITPELLNLAHIRLVDDIIMSPNVVNRPLWMSNPALAPVAQLKSFMFVFGNTVGSRIWSNVVKGRTLEGQPLDVQERAVRAFQVALTFTLLTGATGFMQMFKDALRNWDGEDKDYDAHDTKFWFEAFTSSNLFGPYTTIFQALNAPKYGVSPTVSLLGPSASQGERLLKAAGTFYTNGNPTPFVRELVRMIPFLGANPAARRSIVTDLENSIRNGELDVREITDMLS